jgi:hypothetical protein
MPRTRTQDRARHARVSELDVIEERMGRVASLLSEMADALSEYPDALHLQSVGGDAPERTRTDTITMRASEWPSFEEIQKLVARWRREQARIADVPTAPVVHRRLERV